MFKASKQPYGKNGTRNAILLLWIKSSKKPQIKKRIVKQTPQKKKSDSKYNFKIFKNPIKLKKRPPKAPKIKKTYKEVSNKKVS